MKINKKLTVYACIFAVFVICLVIFVKISPKGDIVVIKSANKVIDTVDLKAVTDAYEITVENGGYNKIRITRDGVKVYSANCHDKLCIEQSNEGIYPIICLPHKLVIDKKSYALD